jgi:DNA-directed RNA polymerase subunit K/omega
MSDEQKPVEGSTQLPAFADSRFLFVDVAAQRAKQLRRGALARLQPTTDGTGHRTEMPHKLERVAMEEVRQGLIIVHAPPLKGSRGETL